MDHSAEWVIDQLKQMANPDFVAGISRFGIPTENVIGIRSPELRKVAKALGVNQGLADSLWKSHIHEAKLLATYIADPGKITIEKSEDWFGDIYSWDICDSFCRTLADTDYAYTQAMVWSSRDEEFVKRGGFATMVNLAIHDKKAHDHQLEAFFPFIIREAWDERNFVRKAVSWALRQIGKRNPVLHQKAIEVAHQIKNQGTPSAKWIANDALRELTSMAVIGRLNKKS
ncbi:MAG: DNA alkylation repair protein [Cyclobacteriaceae bacterium]